MKRRRYIFKIYPDGADAGKEFSVSVNFLKLFVFAIIFFVISFGILFYHFLHYNISSYRLNKYAIENKYLKNKVKELENKVALLDSTIDEYYHRYAALATYAGVEPPPKELKNIGIGGIVEEPPSPDLKSVTHLDDKLSKLERFVDIQLSSFKDVEKKLQKDKFIRDHTPSILPCNGRFTSGFGMRRDPFTGRMHFHRGIDLAAPVGTPVYAPADGTVKKIKWDVRGYGLLLEINHGMGITTLYGHLSKVLVKPGQKVKRGQIIARVGNTGRSTGPHLHYEVRILNRPVNPVNYIIPYQTFFN